jgi:hypothetical protein
VGREQQILQDLDLVFLEQRRVDLQRLHLELAGERHPHQAAAGLPGRFEHGDLLLHGLEFGLHLLRLAHQSEQILHGRLLCQHMTPKPETVRKGSCAN